MTRENLVALGSRIKELRKALKISQKDFAASLDMSGCYLSEIESGKGNPGHKFFYKISALYNISLDYLFHGIGEMFLKVKDKGTPGKKDFIDEIETIDDLVWLLEHSPMVKLTVMGYATKFLYENEDIIKRNIEKYRVKKAEKAAPGSEQK